MRLPFNVNRSNALPLARFMLAERFQRWRDRRRGRAPREVRALEYVRAHAKEGDPESVLTAFDEFGRREAFLMNIGDKKGEILDRVVSDSSAERVLEIGAYCGYSAVRIGRLLAHRGGKLTSVEASEEYAAIARQSVAFAGLSQVVEWVVAKAEDALPGLQGRYDVILLDHWKDLYLPDLRRIEAQGLLRPGSVVVADNIGLFDSRAYLEHVRNSGLYDSVHYPSTVEYRDHIHDAVEVSTWRGSAP